MSEPKETGHSPKFKSKMESAQIISSIWNRVPQEYAPSGYWENSNTVYPYILLKRYADDKYDGFLLVLDDADANGLYLMQCLD